MIMMKKLAFLLLSIPLSYAERSGARRIRTILEIPDDISAATTAIKPSSSVGGWDTADKELADFFARTLHGNNWSLSYASHGHSHGHNHQHRHDHHHAHHHDHQGHHQGSGGRSSSSSSYRDDDGHDNNTEPYEQNDEDDTNLVTPSELPTDDTTGEGGATEGGASGGTGGGGPGGATTEDDGNLGPIAPSPAFAAPSDTLLPTTELVVPNEVQGNFTDVPAVGGRSCSQNPACTGEVGICCPDFNGVFKACCFGVTPPSDTVLPEFPGAAPISVETPFTSPAAIVVDTPSPSALPSDIPSSYPSSSPSSLPSDLPSGLPSDLPSSAPAANANNALRTATIESKCGVSESDRSSLIMASLNPDVDTPAFQAYFWLDFHDDQILCPRDPKLTQRYALATIYFSMNGPNWTNADRWLSSTNECDWFGVACNSNDEVTVLTLKENGLSGDLPDAVFTLSSLTGLSLDHNKEISGSIPPTIAQLTVLEYIELDDNKMTGTIPDELYAMTTLKAIDLNGNAFTGTIADKISNLSKLMVLQLEGNEFDGLLPWFGLAMLKDLLVLYLHDNDFESGSLEPICNLMESRRNSYPGYLQFMAADCDSVACSCCSQCF